MFMTPVDGIVILVTVISAFLAMVRGFSREVLSLVSWLVAAIAAYMLYPYLVPILMGHLSSVLIATAVAAAVIFLVAFIIISVITMKIADLIIDSKIGALDRTIGFIFGILRGLLIIAVATLLINHMVKPEKQHAWIAEAKTKPMFDALSVKIWDVLPKNPQDYLEDLLGPKDNKDTTNGPVESPVMPE